MGKAIREYNIPRRKVTIMTKCYRVICDSEDWQAGSGVTMHGDLADQSKDYANQWGKRMSLLYFDIFESVLIQYQDSPGAQSSML